MTKIQKPFLTKNLKLVAAINKQRPTLITNIIKILFSLFDYIKIRLMSYPDVKGSNEAIYRHTPESIL